MPNVSRRIASLLSLVVVGFVAGCGAEESDPPKGMLRIRNTLSVPIYDMNTKPTGTNDWENITPWIGDGGSKLDPNYNVNVPVPYGPKDFKYTYFDEAKQPVTKLYTNAFTIGPDKMAVAAVKPGGADFTYTDPPPPSSGGGGSGNCSDNGQSCSSDSVVVTWTNRCAAGPSQAPCYCAAAATYDCFLRKGCYREAGAATQVTRAQLESGRSSEAAKAAALGTQCF